jgi:hypothetical protein
MRHHLRRFWFARSVAVILSALAPAAVAKAQAIHTPAIGSAERTAIVRTLHDGDDSPQSRFTFRQFRVLRAGSRAIAYVHGAGPVGDFQAILKRDGQAPWRKVWGEGDGGSNSCETGAQHYSWALRLIRTYTAAPDAIFPGIVARTEELKRMARADPELQCVGDLDGGPE